MDWGPVAAAGVNSAAGLLGGFMNRGKSQRDLMWEQSKVARDHRKWELHHTPSMEMEGLRRAGINPMLPFANGGSTPGPSGFTPGIAAPVNPGQYLAGAVGSGVSSAIDAFRSEAQVAEAEARADLYLSQALTEAERPASVRAMTEEAIASTLNKQQQARLSVLDQALRAEDIEVRKRDALIASVHAGLWQEADEVVTALLRKLQISEEVVPKVTGTISRLRELDATLQRGAESLWNRAVDWWNSEFD